MLLKSLELQGFKTFPDRTSLLFHDGITAVVGPNGSGKSNISDAVRWVLGEQSTRVLRCTKMEDVIFNGTPKRKALGFAEVTLNIDNSDRRLPMEEDTVAVTRRYYRSGESEYLLNKKNVRLKDINELFMDTGLGRDGYSIIGQGKIDSIVAARSEDRREIFEEAAGISRFRYRKEESERRLRQAEENLLRLEDIVSELESRIGPLKEQAEKAKRYLAFSDEKRAVEIGLWLHTLDESGQTLRQQEDKILTAKNQYESAEQAVARMDEQMEQLFSQSNALSVQIESIRQESSRLEEEAAKKDGEISVLKNDIRHNEDDIVRLQGEITLNNRTGDDMDRDIGEKKRRIEEKKEYIKEKDADFADFSAGLEQLRSTMSENAGRIDALMRQAAELAAREAEARLAEMTASSAISEITLHLEDAGKNLEDRKRQGALCGQNAEELAQEMKELEERIQTLHNTVNGYEIRLEARRKRLESAKQKSGKLRLDAEEQERRAGLLEDLEKNLEGFSVSVKTVMKASARGLLRGVRGPVLRLFRVPGKYAVALETALGGAMQNIVVGDEQDAKHAIAYLKQQNSGRATFLPVSTIRGRELRESGLEKCDGFVGIASELCSCESQYSEIIRSLLGRIAVAEDLDAAVAIARKYSYRFRIVTLDGQVVNAGGSLTGGSLAKNSGLLSRASEIEALRKRASDLREQVGRAEEEEKAAAGEFSAAQAGLSGAKGELSAARDDRVRLESEIQRTQNELQTLQRDCAALEKDCETARTRRTAQEKNRAKAKEDQVTLQKESETVNENLSAVQTQRTEQNRQSDEMNERMRRTEMDRLSARKDLQALLDSVEELEKRRAGHSEKIDELKRSIEQVQFSTRSLISRIEELSLQSAAMKKTASDSAGQVEERNQKRMELEKQTVELRASEREKSDEKEKIGHELARLEERKTGIQKEYDEIISRLWEEYELTRKEAEEQVPEKIQDIPQAQRRLNELKVQIRALGTVNVAALDEYKEVSERYEFLSVQVEDVKKSRDELGSLIETLTRQMRGLFSRRFEEISRIFGETFRDLFGGGTAALSLSEPDEVLTSGIEISVQPPGKIVMHLESLSGGEKALVAIALYFSIMKVNAPPFCVLDEIEAALDDVNVTRFATYLRRMNRDTQFILITHRRGSMEEADRLYGVTMQDEGISKLLEMPAAEAEKKIQMQVNR